MSTYVLIHGSFQGGWVWKEVAAGLRAASQTVYHPSLDGCGERALALRPEINLDSQGQEIAGLLFYEDLTDVILVGTSSGGFTVCRAAEIAPDRVGRLVFIDALVPRTGETGAGINGRAPHDPSDLAYGPAPAEARGIIFEDVEPERQEWALARYTRHPRAPTSEPVDLREFWSRSWTVDVLRCRQSPLPKEDHQRRTTALLGGRYTEIDAGHYPMLSHPEAIIKYLLDL